MMVRISVSTALKKQFRVTGILEINMGYGQTVKDLLDVLRTDHGLEFLEKIDSIVELRRYFIVVVDGKLALLDDVIGPNSVVKIIPPISGG